MKQDAHIYNLRYRAGVPIVATIGSRECSLFARLESTCLAPPFNQQAGLSARQLRLLRRWRQRAPVEQLLRSRWLELRIRRGMPVTREEMRSILEWARHNEVDWDRVLPERINLGRCEPMLVAVLVPVLQWWESGCDEVAVTAVGELLEWQVHLRQLQAQEAFWRQAQAVAPESSRAQLAGAGQRQSRVRAEIARLVSRLEALSGWSRESWPAWERGVEHYLASGQLDAFHPVPPVLTPLWEALQVLGEDTQAVNRVRTWLYDRNLCRIQDHFYWSSA